MLNETPLLFTMLQASMGKIFDRIGQEFPWALRLEDEDFWQMVGDLGKHFAQFEATGDREPFLQRALWWHRVAMEKHTMQARQMDA